MGLGEPIALTLVVTPVTALLIQHATDGSDEQLTVAMGYMCFLFVAGLDAAFSVGLAAITNPLVFFGTLFIAGVAATCLLIVVFKYSLPVSLVRLQPKS